MKSYYISENLKKKHLFVSKLSICAPITSVLLVFILSSDFLYVHLFNWWYTIIHPVVLSFLCVLLSRVDGRMNDKAVKEIPVNLKKVWIAKVLIGIKFSLISCLVLLVSYMLFNVALTNNNIIVIPYRDALTAVIIILITHMWQIPLYLFIGYKAGIFIAIVSSIVFNTILGSVIALTDYWFLYPFSYSSRLLCPILKIMPNGLLLKPQSLSYHPELASYDTVATGIISSIILLILSVWLTTMWYQRKEVK
jgi:ABC-2 type transport system permease protein